jgi:2-dehydro-3-deoxyphosphogluconate aldolase/(4S)-4-hydroxy-2-oxoglutarate aldolase
MSTNSLIFAGIIAIIRSRDAGDLLEAARAMQRGGITAMEVTLTTPGAIKGIEAIAAEMAGKMLVGAGTILSAEDANAAVQAGARFIVTPTLQPDSIEFCRSMSIPICCGCYSTTEMLSAHAAGADFIKVFPATSLGLNGIRAIREALPQLLLIPTGGVTEDNLADFIRIGCPAVAMGSSLVNDAILKDHAWEELENRARKCVTSLEEVRKETPIRK